MNATKTPAQLAYEEDVRRRPTYDNGVPRCTWDQLPDIAQWSWEKNPTPRDWPEQVQA
jgi:hypothetical protein